MFKKIVELIGRIILGLFFFFEAVDTIVYFGETRATLESYGLTFAPNLIIVLSIIILLIGASMVIIGYYANIGALMLFIYWFLFTLIVYSFWNDPLEEKNLAITYFSRNMALCGGLLILVANGATGWSVKRILHVLRLPK